MLKKTFIIFFIFLFSFLINQKEVFSYSRSTHEGLTKEIIDFYNEFNAKDISKENARHIIQGSYDEDSPIIRTLAHFYDPVYNEGLFGKFIASYDWAENTEAQAMMSPKYVLLSRVLSYFGSNSDHSFNRAVYEYVHGDKERAFKSLGHILHLIEDLTVPAHTRDDQHLDGDLYETYSKKYNLDNTNDIALKLIREGRKPKKFSTLFDYFFNLASYTNNNFFSIDTVFEEKYTYPEIKYEKREILSDGTKHLFGYEIHNGRGHKIIEIEKKFDFDKGEIVKNYFIDDMDNSIMLENWSLLSKKAVEYGAGVIELFFEKVREEGDTLALFQKNRDFVSRFYGLKKKSTPATVSISLKEEKIENEIENQKTEEKEKVEDIIIKEEKSPEIEPEKSLEEIDLLENDTEILKDEKTKEDIEKENVPSNKDRVSYPKPVKIQPGYGGGGSISSNFDDDEEESSNGSDSEEIKEEENENQNENDNNQESETSTSTELTLIINSPLDYSIFPTTTIEFLGNLSSENSNSFIISNNFDNSSTTPDENGDWKFVLENFEQGTTTIEFTSVSEEYSTSTSKSINLFIDSISPVFSYFKILQCENSLSKDLCLSVNDDVNLEWETEEKNLSYYSIFLNDIFFASTTENKLEIVSSNNSLNNIKLIAHDIAGNNISTSSSKSIENVEKPVVINEIAWSGTKASSADEWIELYNRSEYEIDLSNIVLVAEDQVPYIELSGTIPSKSFFVIERGEDDLAIDLPADLAVSFGGIGSGSGLNNSGEVLSLIYPIGNISTTTIDSTPSLSDCENSWCAGTGSTEYLSMERIDVDVSGSLSTNWSSNNTYKKNGNDNEGSPINGTPSSSNSTGFSEDGIGYFCPPYDSSFKEGKYYLPTETYCTYIYPHFQSKTAYASVFKGEVGNSTLLTSHLITKHTHSAIQKFENDPYILDLNSGDKIFIAIYQMSELGHCNAEDCDSNLADFKDYFETGNSTPPSGLTEPLQYKVLNWIYGSQ